MMLVLFSRSFRLLPLPIAVRRFITLFRPLASFPPTFQLQSSRQSSAGSTQSCAGGFVRLSSFCPMTRSRRSSVPGSQMCLAPSVESDVNQVLLRRLSSPTAQSGLSISPPPAHLVLGPPRRGGPLLRLTALLQKSEKTFLFLRGTLKIFMIID